MTSQKIARNDFHMGGASGLEPSSTAFPGTAVGSWGRNGATGTQTGIT